ncbi:MAG: hypothetical protein WCH61_10690, partial [bacterium]
FNSGLDRRETRQLAQFCRAECLAGVGRRDEAAALYRQLARDCGDQAGTRVTYFCPQGGGGYHSTKLGALAAERAEQLHQPKK